MKKIIFLCVLCFLFSSSDLSAQETGAAAASSTEVSKSSHWQNWVFAGSALVTAAVGVVIISLNTGGYGH